MDFSLREVRYFVACARTGSFTAAAQELYVSQAAVSRTIASLERTAQRQLLRRVPSGCVLTEAGEQLLGAAQQLLTEAAAFEAELRGDSRSLRVAYAWAALGKRTVQLQRSWAAAHPGIILELQRVNSPRTALAEGTCEVMIARGASASEGLHAVQVGIEPRIATFAADDPEWRRRRSLHMREIAQRTVAIDPLVGTTDATLWPQGAGPQKFVRTYDVDSWLDLIGSGQAVGTTAQATAFHHQRHGIRYLPITDGPQIPVYLCWQRSRSPLGLQELIEQVRTSYGYRPEDRTGTPGGVPG